METNQTAPDAGPAPEDAKGDSAPAGQPADGAVGSAPPAADTPPPGFYAWLRRLGIPRRAGWLGGVCAGIAARIGIDPMIVRGIVVVVAVLGAPLVLLYAIAWLLLPDTEGEIHFERLTRGIVDPATVGIAVMGVIGFVPLVQGGWLGWRWWPDWPSVSVAGIDVVWPLRVLWVLIVVGAIVALVIWLARRSAAQSSPAGVAPRMASATTAGPGFSSGAPSGAGDASTPAATWVAAGATTATPTAPTTPIVPGASAGAGPDTEPPIPAEGADAAAIAEWRAQHEAWRLSHAEWRSGQSEAERAARALAAEENKAKARALAAEADAARAARRASRPRASASFVFTVIGIALVAGGVAAIWALADRDVAGFAIPIALAVSTIVIAVGMIVAAVLRRRSGALAFTAILATFSMFVAVMAAAIVPQGSLVPPGSGLDLAVSQRVVQPFGDAYLYAPPTGAASPAVVELTQGTGNTFLTVSEDARVILDATEAGPIDVVVFSSDGSARPQSAVGDVLMLGGEAGVTDRVDGPADTRLVLKQGSGRVYIEIHEGD